MHLQFCAWKEAKTQPGSDKYKHSFKGFMSYHHQVDAVGSGYCLREKDAKIMADASKVKKPTGKTLCPQYGDNKSTYGNHGTEDLI